MRLGYTFAVHVTILDIMPVERFSTDLKKVVEFCRFDFVYTDCIRAKLAV